VRVNGLFEGITAKILQMVIAKHNNLVKCKITKISAVSSMRFEFVTYRIWKMS
jgi:hypothetical protein